MIIEFHPELFYNIVNRQKITYLFYLCYFNRRYDCFIDISQIIDSPIYASLSSEDKEIIEEYFNRFVNDNVKIDHLISSSEIVGSFDLDEARVYFEQPLSIILENSLNDKYFLQAIINNFKNRGKAIKRHLSHRWIDIVNGGGCENIVNVVNEKLETFLGKPKSPQSYFRCFVIVDSDSHYPGQIKETRKKLTAFLDSVGIKYHILIKREMENYLPDLTIQYVPGNDEFIKAYLKLKPLQKDYFDLQLGFEKNLDSYEQEIQNLYADVSSADMVHFRKGGLKMTNFKADFPKLFEKETVTQENLKQRTEHQGNLAEELETILDEINELL